MTDDIVKRLCEGYALGDRFEAADEIEKLRRMYEFALSTITSQEKEIERAVDDMNKLRAALKPFAVDSLMDNAPTLADYRAAKAALGESDD